MSETQELTKAGDVPSSSQQETRDRILDAAETLFAESGFQSVTLRQITSEAGVNLAAVNYHFGNREGLISEVIARVLDPINRERMRLLDAFELEAGGNPVPASKIVEAAFRPVVIDMPRSHESNCRFLRLAGQCLNERSEHFPETMQRVFRDVTDRFVAAFQRVLPHLGEADIYWRLHFAVGNLLYTLTQDDRLTMISKGKVSAVNPEETMAQLVAYTVAGMEAPAAKRESSGKAGSSMALGLVAALGLFGVSCAATAPPNTKDQAELGAVPENWQADAKNPPGLADREWVSTFHDDKLESLVDEALRHNRDLKAAAARIEIAEANAKIAGADLYPFAQGLFRGSRQKRSFIGFPIGGDPAAPGGGGVSSSLNNEFGLSLDLSWEIDLWGRIRAGQSAVISEAQAVSADRAGAELSIAGQVAKGWFALQEGQEQIELAEKAVEVTQSTEKAIEDRFEAGIAEAGDNLASQLRLSRVDIEIARDALEERKEQVGRISRQMEVLLGRYPAGDIKGKGSLPSPPGQPPAGMPGDLLDRRPDLSASERRLAAADRRLLEAKRALLPSISLTGSPGTASEQIEDILDSSFSIWSLAGSVAQPLLTGGRLKQGVILKRSEIKQAAAEFEQTALTAFGEVENALAAEAYLKRREEALSSAVDLAKEAYESARDEFADGTGDILTILAGQERYFQQQSRLISIRRLRLENRVDLHLALGGGFEASVPKLEPDSGDEA